MATRRDRPGPRGPRRTTPRKTQVLGVSAPITVSWGLGVSKILHSKSTVLSTVRVKVFSRDRV